ncbi:MAG: YlbF family regulator [Bacilli bacterium]|jgi:cell fate (sporulation/competence/biofilm development) regulator YlbF (YheA/YmcA/DUF963 family)
MNKEIYDLVLELRRSLEEDPDVVLLNDLEYAMNGNEDVKRLAEQYATLQSNLNERLAHDEVEHPDVKKMRGELSIIKYNLDLHPVVMAYQNQYKVVNKIYAKVNKQLFQEFCNIKACKCL